MFVGANSAASSSVDISSTGRSGGDILLCLSIRTGGTSAPGTPTGFTSLDTDSINSFGDTGARLSWKVSDGTETTISSTSAALIIVAVYRNGAASPIGAADIEGSYTSINWPAVTQTLAPSWIVCIGYGSSAVPAPVVGYSSRYVSGSFGVFDSAAPVASFSPSGGPSGSHCYAASVELSLRGAPGALFWAFP